MKIDFYISSLSSGGAEHVLINLAGDFAGKGHDVSIVSYEKRQQFYGVPSSVKIVKYDYKNTGKIKSLLLDFIATRRQTKLSRADVAISFLSRCNLMLILASFFTRTKTIVCDRNNLLMKYPKYVFVLSCWLYSFADAVCVQTNEIKKTYPGYLQKKMYVLENPLDFEELHMQIGGMRIEKEKTVLSVGRLEKQKDFISLIKAFKIVSQSFPDWKLKIYGQGNRREELQELIDELQLSEQVALCGVTHTPFLEMKKSRIFVLSSFYEGFPNVLCEAMHAALPCISTRCACGPSDLITDGENGYLVEIGDVSAMAERVISLINDEDLRNKVGSAAEKSVARLERSLICEKWIQMVHQVMAK